MGPDARHCKECVDTAHKDVYGRALATATGTKMNVASIWEYVTDLAHCAAAQDPMTVLPVTDTHNFRLPTTLVYATHGTAESTVLVLSENATTSATVLWSNKQRLRQVRR
jgi:hypothetical protein